MSVNIGQNFIKQKRFVMLIKPILRMAVLWFYEDKAHWLNQSLLQN